MARMSAVDHAVENVLTTLDDSVVDLSESRTNLVYEAVLDELKDRLGLEDTSDDDELPEWDGCEDCGSDPCICEDDDDE